MKKLKLHQNFTNPADTAKSSVKNLATPERLKINELVEEVNRLTEFVKKQEEINYWVGKIIDFQSKINLN